MEHSITQVEIGSSLLEESKEVAISIIHYVARSPEVVILNDAVTTEQFDYDPYLQMAPPKSVFCVPLLNQGQLTGILYLENNLMASAFTPERKSTDHLEKYLRLHYPSGKRNSTRVA